MSYFVYFLLAFFLALTFTPVVRKLAFGLGCVDQPKGGRKIHKNPTALLGGWAVFVSAALTAVLYFMFGSWDHEVVTDRFAIGILLGALLLMVGGFLDDKYDLPPKLSFLFPALASLIVIWFGVGVGIKYITNPFGGQISLNGYLLSLPASAIFIFLWLMGMTYTTKILDGLDGLAAGVSLIAGVVIFCLSLTERINQPVTASLAVILVGALLGYLIFAFNPASIFLGESGSTFLGWFLGVLAILTGAKIATAVLVMGVPILDVAWAILRRVFSGQSPFKADRKHLHFRLLDAGLTQRQAVMVFYGISLIFGFTAIALQSMGKFVALIVLVFAMLGLVYLLLRAKKLHDQP